MTIEQKARAYDKAIEKIKYVMEHDVSPVLNKEDLQDIFPELRESEDERIRKVLIYYFNLYKQQEECGIKTFYGVSTDNILAWLEKQGEQKPKWSEEDEGMMNHCIGAIHIAGCLVANSYTAKDKKAMKDWLKSLKQRLGGEQ